MQIKRAEQIWLPLYEGDCVTVTDRTEHPVGEINFTSRIALVREPYAMWYERRRAMRHLLIPIGRDPQAAVHGVVQCFRD